jgi:predicted nucleotidyltransferase
MSLSGRCRFTFAEGIQYRVIPPPVIALLKVIAFMDDPHRRKKDLLDIGELFRHYEAASDRIFSDDVFAAGLDDIEYANAFLLGVDIRLIATDEEVEILNAFLGAQSVSDEELRELDPEDIRQRGEARFQQQLRAFRRGLEQRRTK